jgi:hypothetical protein
MKLTSQMPSSTSLMPSLWPASAAPPESGVPRARAQVSEVNKGSEAELREVGATLRAIGEGHAPAQTRVEGRRVIREALALVTKNWRDLCVQVMRMALVPPINLLIAPSVGAAAAPGHCDRLNPEKRVQ